MRWRPTRTASARCCRIAPMALRCSDCRLEWRVTSSRVAVPSSTTSELSMRCEWPLPGVPPLEPVPRNRRRMVRSVAGPIALGSSVASDLRAEHDTQCASLAAAHGSSPGLHPGDREPAVNSGDDRAVCRDEQRDADGHDANRGRECSTRNDRQTGQRQSAALPMGLTLSAYFPTQPRRTTKET
jgi:hypothetical protein